MASAAESVRLDWPAGDGLPAQLAAAFAAGARRIEVLIGVSDDRRRHLHGAAFRREGRLRAAWVRHDGSVEDAYLYALLREDLTSGDAVFSTVMNSVLPRTRMIGHAVFRDAMGRVLLQEVSYKRDWELPGGIVEPHESPRLGCEREVYEEIGLTVRLERVACIDWLPPYLGWDDAVEVIFDGGTLTEAEIASMVLAPGEVVAAHWVQPSAVPRHVTPLAARRLEWLLAHPDAPPTLFEDGRPVG